jgi:hypothetical protein
MSARGFLRQSAAPFRKNQRSTMDVEHINAIGNQLADLTKRTVDLRGYL